MLLWKSQLYSIHYYKVRPQEVAEIKNSVRVKKEQKEKTKLTFGIQNSLVMVQHGQM